MPGKGCQHQHSVSSMNSFLRSSPAQVELEGSVVIPNPRAFCPCLPREQHLYLQLKTEPDPNPASALPTTGCSSPSNCTLGEAAMRQ